MLGENARLGVPGRDQIVDAPAEGAAVLVGGLVAAQLLELLDAQPLQPVAYLFDVQRIVALYGWSLGGSSPPLGRYGTPVFFFLGLFPEARFASVHGLPYDASKLLLEAASILPSGPSVFSGVSFGFPRRDPLGIFATLPPDAFLGRLRTRLEKGERRVQEVRGGA